jgi:hypothetical protein
VNSIRRFLILSAAAVLTACAARPAGTGVGRRILAERAAGNRELAVLFIGNSYSFGVPKAFAKLAARRGKTVKVDQVTHNGWTLARHAASPETLAKIRAGGWDVIVIQEQSRIPSLPALRPVLMFPHVRTLAAEARNRNAVPVIYQTWGYRDGDRKRPGDDFHAMTRRVRDGCAQAAEHAGGLAVVPAGEFWEREVSSGRGGPLFMPDGSHPSPRGESIAAEAFFETLFGK